MLQYTKLTWYKHVKAKYKGANIKADVTSQVRKILATGAEHVLDPVYMEWGTPV